MADSPTINEGREPRPSIDKAGVECAAPVPRSRLGTLARASVRLRLSNDDGTPTAWCAFIGIVAPSLVVLSIIAGAIFGY